uniref:Pro-secreted protein ORF2 n=1 Tax=Galago hepevirus TaxID=2796359 RepID=A0A8E0KH93_9VIRU|nr:TPA: ORF2 protein [Galago hepevirus]
MLRAASLALLLLCSAMLPASGAGPWGRDGPGGQRQSRRRGRFGQPDWPDGPRAPAYSPQNPFLAEIEEQKALRRAAAAKPALGTAWVDASNLQSTSGRRRNAPAGSTPLTAVAPAPGTPPVPDTTSQGAVLRRQYNLSTSPLSVTIATGTNLVLYAAPLNPLLPLQDGTNTHIMSTEASNYAQYRMVRATVRFRPLVPNSVGGYAISMSFWPQTTTTPTSVDMNSITATDVRIVVQPGLSAELVIPNERLHYRNEGWRSVETNGVSEEEATSGMLLLCIHGTPVNSFTNTPYTGALGLLDFALDLQLRNLTPGNTNQRLNRYRATAKHKIKRDAKGQATITTAAASRFMSDIHLSTGVNGLGDLGRGIVTTIFNIADTLLGGLPTELVSAAGGQLLYGRPVASQNSEPTLKLYTSVENAQLDKGINLSHDVDLGLSAVTVQDYDNQHVQDRPTPSPAPQRPLLTMRTGDVLWVTLPEAVYTQASGVPSSTSPVYYSPNSVVINVATGAQALAGDLDWTKATLNGQALPLVKVGEDAWFRIPLYGKLSFWEQGKAKAGYTYNYNTTDSDSIYVLAIKPHSLYISTYTTSLGAGPVAITGVGAIGPNPVDAASASVLEASNHTFDGCCPECRALGLHQCILMTTLQQLRDAVISGSTVSV